MRVQAIIAYDGNFFKGFQQQKSTNNTVTTAIETALKALGIHSPIRGSGRTDAGVHATAQSIDFKLPPYWRDLEKLKKALNQKLKFIVVKQITPVSDDFHSRFWAKRRRYRYIFKTTPLVVFEQNYVASYGNFEQPLLKEALTLFQGEHDFSNFIKTGSTTHTNVRTIYKALYRPYRNYHLITFEANGFLRSQVRMMVEGAMQVAQGKLSLERLSAQLNLQDKSMTKLAPAEGLYLSKIIY